MKSFIPYSKQSIDKADTKAINKVLNSNYLTKGKVTKQFENNINSFCNSKFSVATINASCSLLLACKALNVTSKDIVWTSNITYIASINCALHLNAKIDLLEISNDNYNICIKLLEKKLKTAKKKNCLPKVIIPVHLSGLSCDMKKIKKLSKIYKFKIIEDASHAFGGNYNNSPIGSCKYSDMCVFSFHPVKNITTAEGGAITTNNSKIYKKLISLRENGQTFDRINNLKFPTRYNVKDLGYNFRINEINSALGISQIKKTKKFINIKKIIARRYFNELKIKEIILPNRSILQNSALHLFIIQIRFKLLKIKKFDLIKALNKKNIFVNTHYIPLSSFTLIKKYIQSKSKFSISQNYYDNAISIPFYPDLNYKDQTKVIKEIKKIVSSSKK